MVVSKRVGLVLAASVGALCLAASSWQLKYPFELQDPQTDFEAYYTAASLIHEHHGEYIYDGADTGLDPQLRLADAGSIFARQALAHRIREVHLYLYPPLLAYLTVPFTYLSVPAASTVWRVCNCLAVIVAAILLSRLMGLRAVGLGGVAVLLFLFEYRPSLECFRYGQIPIMLTFFDVAGMFLYARGHKAAAALLFATAAAIKLTPAIVIVPLIAWRDWQTLRAFALWCIPIVGALCFPDRGKLLLHFIQNVLPAMSGGIVAIDNKGLSSSVQFFWMTVTHGGAPGWLGAAAKATGALAVIYAGWLCRAKLGDGNLIARVEALSLFLLLSCCVAPVSWRHAYVASAPALVILFMRMLGGKTQIGEAATLCCFTLSISSYGFAQLAVSSGNPILALWANGTPALGIALVIVALRRLRSEPEGAGPLAAPAAFVTV